MGRQMIWVTNGPKAGEFMEVDDDDADLAEQEGWGQKTFGRDGDQMRHAVKDSHRSAKAYLDRNRKSGYENRELRAADPPTPKGEVKTRNAGGNRSPVVS